MGEVIHGEGVRGWGGQIDWNIFFVLMDFKKTKINPMLAQQGHVGATTCGHVKVRPECRGFGGDKGRILSTHLSLYDLHHQPKHTFLSNI